MLKTFFHRRGEGRRGARKYAEFSNFFAKILQEAQMRCNEIFSLRRVSLKHVQYFS